VREHGRLTERLRPWTWAEAQRGRPQGASMDALLHKQRNQFDAGLRNRGWRIESKTYRREELKVSNIFLHSFLSLPNKRPIRNSRL